MKSIKILNLSDIHIGHPNTHANFMFENIKKFFFKHTKLFENLDIITLSGDLTHKLLPTNSNDYSVFTDLLIFLVSFCSNNNIKLRALEGTKSHDMGQMKNFYKIIDKLNYNVDFKYVDTLFIEHMKDLNFTILYVPDELNNSNAKETFKDVLNLMKEHGLSKVNHVILHGQWNYNLPVSSKANHNEEDYLSICDGFISCGHIHEFSTYDRIIMTGSFDRHNHGSECKKGTVLFEYNELGNEYLFLENENAKIYKTIHMEKYNPNELIAIIKKLKLPAGSFIRVKTKDLSIDKSVIKDIKNLFQDYTIDFASNKKEKTDVRSALSEEIVGLQITNDNIVSLVEEELENFNIVNKLDFIEELKKHI